MSTTPKPRPEAGPPPAPSGARYVVVRVDARAARQQLIDTWARCSAQPGAAAPDLGPKFDWLYIGNPAGDALTYLLKNEPSGAIVGMIAMVRRRFVIDGRPVTGVMRIDFIIEPAHRKFFPALTLQKGARALALEECDFAYGLPNEQARGLFARLSEDVQFDRARYACALNYFPYLKKRRMPALAAFFGALVLNLGTWSWDAVRTGRRRRVRAEWLGGFDERFDELWSRAPTAGRCIGVRDQSFLKWRFQPQPERVYRTIGMFAAGSAQLCGYFVVELTGGGFDVRDMLCVGGPDLQLACWFALRRAARKAGANGIVCELHYYGEGGTELMRLAGFQRRGGAVAYAKLGKAVEGPVARSHASWYLTSADEDQ